MKIQESGENYLETILILKKRNGSVRAIDIANELNFSKPSVSKAMSVLKEAGHVKVDRLNQILLTDTGLKLAEKVYEKHLVLTEYLISIGVSEETAAKDACKMEHVISEESFVKIKNLVGNNKKKETEKL
ncbi:MAG: metal-dependent transcriptional regulator [Clostridiales bacterium]|jgi:Mn-dependent DtxR family transcriptional regulator|nr:metal-dependent transcriptional regulator [Clostridiales bacterium]